jgi:hypothetical protein
MNGVSAKLLSRLGLAALLLSPAPAYGFFPLFRSSMTAQCVGLVPESCQTIRFRLDVEGDHRLLGVGILNANTALWNFAGVESVTNTSGEDVQWWTTVFAPDRVELELALGIGYPAVEPIVFTVNMQGSTGTADHLGSSFSYFGVGCQGLTDCTSKFSVQGDVALETTITPEPETLVLLAIGLALLGGLVGVRTLT